MHASRKPDGCVTPAKSANKDAPEASAEWMEERHPAKRNAAQPAPPRTPSRKQAGTAGLDRVREAARKDGDLRLTALPHHADVDALRRSFFKLKKNAAVGIDGVTWHDYEHGLEVNLTDLHGRIHRGSYRAKPSLRRYADDFVIGFQHRAEAEACLEELRARFAGFGLRLHEGKTRLIEFGRFAAANRKRRGEGKPETFDFLGFTHKCAARRSDGSFTIHRHTVAKRMRATLLAIRLELRKRMHHPLGEVGRWLRRVVQGWMNDHAVPNNNDRIRRFVDEVPRTWLRAIRRRSQRGKNPWTWERMRRLGRKHLPQPHMIHPYLEQRFRARLKAGAV